MRAGGSAALAATRSHRGRGTARSCTGVDRRQRQSPSRQRPRRGCDKDDVKFWCVGRGSERTGRPEDAEDAMLVGGRAFGRGPVPAIMATQRRTCPIDRIDGVGGDLRTSHRKHHALEQKGKDQDGGGQLPPHAPGALRQAVHENPQSSDITGPIASETSRLERPLFGLARVCGFLAELHLRAAPPSLCKILLLRSGAVMRSGATRSRFSLR
jgi:hypothetical protein